MSTPIVEVPSSIKKYCQRFRNLFGNERQFLHFERYMTGLIVSENVTVEGINELFTDGTDSSNLNRFLTGSPWSAVELNDKRLALLQKDILTRWGKRGVVALDDTMNRHDGKHFDLIGKLFDHAEGDYPMAHNLVTSHYVGPNVQYPIDYRLFIPKSVATKEGLPFKTHTEMAIELVHDAEKRKCPASCYTFDAAYTVQDLTAVIESYGKMWVGVLKSNRWITVGNKRIKVLDFARELPESAYREILLGDKQYWVFSKVVRVSHFDNRLRIVISFDNAKREGEPKFFVTNGLSWEAIRVLTSYDCRWSVETFYRDSKQELGLDGYELRAESGFRRHWYLVFAAYSCLLSELQACGRRRWFTAKLLTIGEARRNVVGQTLKSLVSWVREKSQAQWSSMEIYECLALT
jgi:SRSO17 transposase